jgi:uncharacterized protein (TIRG00374 family)
MQQSGNQNRALAAGIVCLVLLSILVVSLDWRDVRGSIVAAEWEPMLAAMATAFLAYACSAYSYALLNRAFAISLDQRTLFGIGFVSSAMITAIGGVAGHSLRILLMVRRGVSTGDALAPSLFHGYLESLIFFALIPGGLAYLALSHSLPASLAFATGVGAVALGLAFAATAVVFFVHPVRRMALRFVGLAGWMITRRNLDRGLQDFDDTLRNGLSQVRNRPLSLIVPVALIGADRATRIAAVWLCFEALGSGVAPEVIVTGFAIGVAVGVMSMVPGGVGVQEASMAGVYHLLGVSLEQAVLVSLLFRVVYSVVPFGASLAFYTKVIRQRRP